MDGDENSRNTLNNPELSHLLDEIEQLQEQIRACERHHQLSREHATRLLGQLAPCVLQIQAARRS